MLRYILFSISVIAFCKNILAFPSEDEIRKVEIKAENGQLLDAYYLNELFKKCHSTEEVNALSERLTTSFSDLEQIQLLQISKARRTEYFGDHISAFKILKNLRQTNFKNPSPIVRSEYYSILGYIALNSGKPLLALEYSKKALKYSSRGNNNELIQSHYMSIGVVYNALGRTDEASAQFDKAEEFELNGPNRNSLYLKLNRALVESNKGNLEVAKEKFRNILRVIRSNNDVYAEIRTIGNIADILSQQDSLDASVTLLNKSRGLIEKSGQKMDLIFVYSKLAKIYHLKGDHKEAYTLLTEVLKLQNDNTKVFDVASNIQELEASQEIKTVNLEKEKIKELQRREENLNLLLIIFILVLLVAMSLLFVLNTKIRRKNDLLMNHEKKRLNGKQKESKKGLEIITRLEELSQEDQIFKSTDLTIEKAAKLLGTNRTYLSEAINSCTGMSFSKWLVVQRVEAAKKLLAAKNNSQYSIEGISQMVGFASISAFNTNFKKLTGVTPSYYRKAIDK